MQTQGQKRPPIVAPTSEAATFAQDLLPKLPSQTGDQLERATRQARRASIDLAFVAGVIAAANTAAPKTTSTSEQLDVSTIADEAVRSVSKSIQ